MLLSTKPVLVRILVNIVGLTSLHGIANWISKAQDLRKTEPIFESLDGRNFEGQILSGKLRYKPADGHVTNSNEENEAIVE